MIGEKTMETNILVYNGYVSVPKSQTRKDAEIRNLATVAANVISYGYVFSAEVMEALSRLNAGELADFWRDTEVALKEVTGANRNMDRYVVYKNFPKEVLDMSQSEYWIKQICMYLGMPNHWFTEEEDDRPEMKEKLSLKVLALASQDALAQIYQNLKNNKSRWSDNQTTHAKHLFSSLKVALVNVDEFSFKENGILIASTAVANKIPVSVSTATDVLRLAAGMSDQDISLRTSVRFKNFKRPERKLLLSLLNDNKNLIDDFGMRAETWKRLLSRLRPNEYGFAKNVSEAYALLYAGEYETFDARIERLLSAKDTEVFTHLRPRAGVFLRRLHKLYATFGNTAIVEFITVLPNLSNGQLIKLDKYLSTINNRVSFIVAPRGNWNRAKILPNKKVAFSVTDLDQLRTAIAFQINNNFKTILPEGVNLQDKVHDIKLQTNDQKLAEYGRGTVFDIPAEMTFARSASFWKAKGYGNIWYDNGWNFFDDNWKSVGTCCWNHSHDMNGAAVFSGDPTNSKNLDGGACQMIDLYFDKLAQRGVRFAVWNVLCYSNQAFNMAEEVLATLQLGESAVSGNLYEPARAQMVFPLKGDNMTKFVAYIDVHNRKLVYMDANFKGRVDSAGGNTGVLEQNMPAYVEYLDALPSVGDLFEKAEHGTFPVAYSDKDITLVDGDTAYIFRSENPDNVFVKKDIADFLG